MNKGNIMTTVSGIIMLISGLIFIGSIIYQSSVPKMPKVGEVYAVTNPGISDDPDKKPHPWVGIYLVEEIRDGKARCKYYTIRIGGGALEYEVWDSSFELGRFHKKLNSID